VSRSLVPVSRAVAVRGASSGGGPSQSGGSGGGGGSSCRSEPMPGMWLFPAGFAGAAILGGWLFGLLVPALVVVLLLVALFCLALWLTTRQVEAESARRAAAFAAANPPPVQSEPTVRPPVTVTASVVEPDAPVRPILEPAPLALTAGPVDEEDQVDVVYIRQWHGIGKGRPMEVLRPWSGDGS
jgi:hypothetical protein